MSVTSEKVSDKSKRFPSKTCLYPAQVFEPEFVIGDKSPLSTEMPSTGMTLVQWFLEAYLRVRRGFWRPTYVFVARQLRWLILQHQKGPQV
jgi:hypothetical protein